MADSTSLSSGVAEAVDADPTGVVDAHQIADGIARFAMELHETDVDSIELTRLIVRGAVKLIPGADYAAVLSVAGKNTLRADITTDESLPGRVLELQNAAGEGPCLEAIATGSQVRIVDLTSETRWPRFTAAAMDTGAVGMLSTPMALGNRTAATLTLIGTSIPFDDEAGSLARIFAAHAGIALSGAMREESLAAALSSREAIGQAKGILMERFKMTDSVAFAALVKVSADNNIKLRTVCEQLCRTGVLASSPPRRATRPSSATRR